MTKLRTLRARQSSLIRDTGWRANSEHGRTIVWAHAISVILAITLAPRIWAQQKSMDGLTATLAIRNGERKTSTRTPIFAMTAHATSDVRDRCLAAGMNGYLTKPIQPAELLATLESVQPMQRLADVFAPALHD